MRLLRIIPSIDPKAGGPVEGARQIDACLLKSGHEVEVVCLDSPEAITCLEYPAKVHPLGPAKLGYRFAPALVPWLRENRARFDAVVVNGLWQYHSLAAWRALAATDTPYFVFTHGMLDPWFKHTYPLKHLKKLAYWLCGEYRVLRDARAVLFTSEEERLRARESFRLYRCHEAVTSYGTNSPPEDAGGSLSEGFIKNFPELSGKRILLFLSRIHEKKGCDILIEAFAKVANRDPHLHLVIAGPDQTGLVSLLKARAEKLCVADRITWAGMLQGQEKWGAFYAAEAFCLPSHQENFGIVVAEALSCGKPALISNKVNIWREVQADGAGIVGNDTVEGTVEALEQWVGLSEEARRAAQRASRRCFEDRFSIDRVADSLIKIIGADASSKARRLERCRC